MEDINPLAARYHDILDDPDAFGRAIARPIDRFLWIHHQRTDVDAVKRILIRSGFAIQNLPWHSHALRLCGDAVGLGRHI